MIKNLIKVRIFPIFFFCGVFILLFTGAIYLKKTPAYGSNLSCDTEPNCEVPASCACDGGIVELTVKYIGTHSGVKIEVSDEDHYPITDPAHLATTFYNVQPNQILRINAAELNFRDGKLHAFTYLFVNGVLHGTYHTTCTYGRLLIALTSDQFKSISYIDKQGQTCSINSKPVANNDSVTTCNNTVKVINILTNDSDVDGNLDVSSVSITQAPYGGTITSINRFTGAVTYTPLSSYQGTDTFIYKVCDTSGCCDTATVLITVDNCPVCGNGVVDPGEECDDGNTNNNDSCRNNCTLPKCGDGIKDPNEECDDGNTNNNDECRNDCTLPYCGDSIKDPGEECDPPGPSTTCTSGTCLSNCLCAPTAYCGNGVVDPGEECDDGNKNNEDSCRNNCKLPKCGDGIIDPGEECDDGNTTSGDGCSATCTREKTTIIATKIVCDKEEDLPNWGGGGPDVGSNTASDYVASHPTCHFESNWYFQWGYASAPNPGDNTGEAPVSSGWYTFGPTNTSGVTSVEINDLKGTSRLWFREVFQQGYVPFSYSIDNSSVSAEFYCNNDVLNYDNWDWIMNPSYNTTYYCVGFNAHVQTQYCGNGVVDPGEECDDGNTNNNDGCRNNCKLPYCGDGIVDPNKECDPQAIPTGCYPSGTCNTNCQCEYPEAYFNLAVCYIGAIGQQATNARFGYLAHDILFGNVQVNTMTNNGILPQGIPVGQNSPRVWSTNVYQLNLNNYVWTVKIDGVQKTATIDMLDGPFSTVTQYNQCPIETAVCGNGVLEPGEACDDGNTNNDDSCRNDCTIPYCGDGIKEQNEECDPPGPNNICDSGMCLNDCTCKKPPVCGDGTIDQGEQCDPAGPSALCSSGTCASDCTCSPPPICGDGNLDTGEQCDPPGLTGTCASGVCALDCTCSPPPSCGDGNLDTGEECDPPGQTTSCASGTCESNCTCKKVPQCGDSVLDEGEECDPPGNSTECTSGTCQSNCKCSPPKFCGNGTIDTGEQCDPPGATSACSTGQCANDCSCTQPPQCGNGILDIDEQCDPPGTFLQCPFGACNLNCTCATPPSCGNATIEVGEQCDPAGPSTTCASGICAANCTCTTPPTCGNGAVDTGEECDPPGSGGQCTYGTCTGTCVCPTKPINIITPPRSVNACGIIFGANEFILSGQSSPISSYGIIEFKVNDVQKFYLEAKNVYKASVVNKDTLDEYPLHYDQDLKLWTGDLVFTVPGKYKLEAVISSEKCVYRRDINTVFVSDKSSVIDITTGNTIPTVTVTVYEKDVQSNRFRLWDGSMYGEINPFSLKNKDFSVIVPEGEYYLTVDSLGYQRATSLITTVQSQSVVTAHVQLQPEGSQLGQFVAQFNANSEITNFPLEVSQLGVDYLLPLEDKVSDTVLYDNQRNKLNLFDLLSDTKPAVIFVYSSWNILANEQIEVYQEVRDALSDKYDFIPISTMEPDSVTKSFLKRGRYSFQVYKPEDTFFDDYKIISLPQFFLIDKDKVLKNVITGPQSKDGLINKINSSLENL
jgi:cysteine-rich repeat protein